eukprot:3635777-Pleurochrysis_carterae.AAC.1
MLSQWRVVWTADRLHTHAAGVHLHQLLHVYPQLPKSARESPILLIAGQSAGSATTSRPLPKQTIY